MGSISSFPSSYLQSIVGTALSAAGVGSGAAAQTNLSPVTTSDSQQLSPFAKLVSTLQQLQQSDRAKYSQVTQQIATNLQTAAQSAQSAGNTTQATQLSQLATDFTSASKSGQLPNLQDLAQAVTGGHGHHHHGHGAKSSADTDGDLGTTAASSTASSATAGAATSSALNQILSLFQSTPAQTSSTDPGSIILSTLANAGIPGA
jgi:hypothetical protein